jgi:diguanylate cyclase (GGDEF)-like protein
MDWSKLPDVGAVALLACAFASVARRSQTHVSGLWLTGWLMIALHFTAFIFLPVPGFWGNLALLTGVAALTWAGLLFMWACVPFRNERSSPWMLAVLVGTNTLYIAVVTIAPSAFWALMVSASLLGVLPLALTLVTLHRFNSPLRWMMVLINCLLSVFLLIFQNRPGNGPDLAVNAVLFTVYLGCCLHFLYRYKRATAGAFVTIAGFATWAAVFVVAPGMAAFLPGFHLESEVWNLPKYVVAVGMILLLLEDQIAHNKFLALHDELTGLPNRRLFQDRMTSAIERARRSGTHTALLLVDLDRFKLVNDTLGHHVGDLLLQFVSSIFVGRVRRSDTVARTGGDEFCVILEEPVSRADAERVGDSLMQLLNEPLELGEHTVQIGASVGIAVFPEDADTMEALCIKADLQMYADKHRTGGSENHAGAMAESQQIAGQKMQESYRREKYEMLQPPKER